MKIQNYLFALIFMTFSACSSEDKPISYDFDNSPNQEEELMATCISMRK